MIGKEVRELLESASAALDLADTSLDAVKAAQMALLGAIAIASPIRLTAQHHWHLPLARVAHLCAIALDLDALIHSGISDSLDFAHCIADVRGRLDALLADRPLESLLDAPGALEQPAGHA